jgi:hypothetical protein
MKNPLMNPSWRERAGWERSENGIGFQLELTIRELRRIDVGRERRARYNMTEGSGRPSF